MNITKAIIPAAGLGTRFLPFTKAVPKEMVPLLNKPALHYILEEGLGSGIEHFSIVTSKEKKAIEQYLSPNPEVEQFLKDRNKSGLIASINEIMQRATFSYTLQGEPLGLGHAVWTARHDIGHEYFGIFLPDDIMLSQTPALKQLISAAQEHNASVIAVQEVPMESVSSYGVIRVKNALSDRLFEVESLVEKPAQKDAPSNLAVIGRYVLSHKIFASLENIHAGAGGELQLTDGINAMMNQQERVFAYKVEGSRFDTGTPVGWVKAIVRLALQNGEFNAEIRSFMRSELGL